MKPGKRQHEGSSCEVRISMALPVKMHEQTREIRGVHTTLSERGEGNATQLIHNVCKEADESNITLVIWPNPYGDDSSLNQKELIAWYEKFGFVMIQPRPYMMVRMPWSTPRVFSDIAQAAFEAVQ